MLLDLRRRYYADSYDVYTLCRYDTLLLRCQRDAEAMPSPAAYTTISFTTAA